MPTYIRSLTKISLCVLLTVVSSTAYGQQLTKGPSVSSMAYVPLIEDPYELLADMLAEAANAESEDELFDTIEAHAKELASMSDRFEGIAPEALYGMALRHSLEQQAVVSDFDTDVLEPSDIVDFAYSSLSFGKAWAEDNLDDLRRSDAAFQGFARDMVDWFDVEVSLGSPWIDPSIRGDLIASEGLVDELFMEVLSELKDIVAADMHDVHNVHDAVNMVDGILDRVAHSMMGMTHTLSEGEEAGISVGASGAGNAWLAAAKGAGGRALFAAAVKGALAGVLSYTFYWLIKEAIISTDRDRDEDGDGIVNWLDKDIDGDGVNNELDLDDDGDGILDIYDRRPRNKNRGGPRKTGKNEEKKEEKKDKDKKKKKGEEEEKEGDIMPGSCVLLTPALEEKLSRALEVRTMYEMHQVRMNPVRW